MISFEVPGVPNSQPRQRHALRRTKAGKTFIHNYTDEKHPVNTYKAVVRLCCKSAMRSIELMSGPVEMQLLFVFPRSKAQTTKNKPMHRLPHAKKPDLDNLEKAILDALNGVAWVDDSQVCKVLKEKIIAAGDEQPRTIVRIRPYVLRDCDGSTKNTSARSEPTG